MPNALWLGFPYKFYTIYTVNDFAIHFGIGTFLLDVFIYYFIYTLIYVIADKVRNAIKKEISKWMLRYRNEGIENKW